jgi:methyl-accepting chemotaxis protein
VQDASSVVKKSFEKIKSAGDVVTGTFDRIESFGKRTKDSIKSASSSIVTAFDRMTTPIEDLDDDFEGLEFRADDLAEAYDKLKERFDEGRDLAELGAVSLRVEERFGKFAEAAGGADEIMAAFQKGVGGTAKEMEAMSVSSGLLQAGLVGSAAEMERVTNIASRLGDQTIGVTDRIGEFGQLLKNQSIDLLDNFGISSGKVRAEIERLQAADANLSREQAFLTATFAEADRALAILGPRTEDHLTAMERQEAAAANLEVEIGQKLAPAYSKLADFQGRMSAETAIAIKGFQKGFGTAAELSGGIDKLAANFGKLATKMGTSSAALGGLGLAVGALVLANEKLQQQLDKMNNAFEESEKAGDALGSSLEGLTIGSEEWDKALDGVVNKMDKANKKYEDSAIASGIIGDAFGADAAMAEVMGAALDSVDDEIQRGSNSYATYIKNVKAANDALKKTGQTIVAVDKVSFEMHKRIEQSQVSWDNLTAAEQRNQNQIAEQIAAMDGLTWAEAQAKVALDETIAAQEAQAQALERTFPLWEAANANRERGADRAAQMADVTEHLSEQIGTQSTRLEDLARAEEQQAAIAEKAAAVADMQAESHQRAAEMMEMEREKTNALAQETANLSIALKDATKETIARNFIGMLDPEKMGATAYTKAVTEIGLKSGIMDEESVRLATSMTELAEAVNENLIPMDDVSEALDAVTDNAETGEEAVEDLISQFEKAPSAITPVGNALDDAGSGMATIALQGGEAALMIDSFGESTKNATPALKNFQDKLDATESNLIGLVGGSPWVVTVTADPVDGDSPDPLNNRQSFGGQSFAGVGAGGTNIEEMTVNVQVVEPSEIEDTFEGIMVWAGRSG